MLDALNEPRKRILSAVEGHVLLKDVIKIDNPRVPDQQGTLPSKSQQGTLPSKRAPQPKEAAKLDKHGIMGEPPIGGA